MAHTFEDLRHKWASTISDWDWKTPHWSEMSMYSSAHSMDMMINREHHNTSTPSHKQGVDRSIHWRKCASINQSFMSLWMNTLSQLAEQAVVHTTLKTEHSEWMMPYFHLYRHGCVTHGALHHLPVNWLDFVGSSLRIMYWHILKEIHLLLMVLYFCTYLILAWWFLCATIIIRETDRQTDIYIYIYIYIYSIYIDR